MQARALVLAVLASACLAACQRGADSGATSSPNAPGSPGTGNAASVSVPQQGESSSGSGPSGVAGSAPHPGASGGDVVRGASGKGTSDNAARSQTAQPGSGLNGGLGATDGTTALGAGPAGTNPTKTGGADQANQQESAAQGSTNRTPGGAVGRR
jgi:hypothetical protein